MTLKFKVKQQKKWAELSLEQKVNVLKMQSEGRGLSWFVTSMKLTAFFFLFTLIMLTWYFQYQRMNPETALSFAIVTIGLSKLTGFFGAMSIIAFFVDVLLELRRQKKWRPFTKSLQKDKEVKF